MNLYTQKYNEEEMMQILCQLLNAGESIKTALYCVYKGTGFFASYRNIVAGYIALTDNDRLIGMKFGTFGSEAVSQYMGYAKKITVKNYPFGQKVVHMIFDDGKKQEVKIQLAPKMVGSKFPDQQKNFDIFMDELNAKINLLEQ